MNQFKSTVLLEQMQVYIFEETNKNYQVIENGKKLQCPKTPSKDGCVFDGWYSDYAYSKKWDFENDTVSDSMTLVAKWI